MEYTADTWPDGRWPNFKFEEFSCSHSGACMMNPEFMDKLQDLRDEMGPLHITSGYRSLTHPNEIKKDRPGAHTHGRACDIAMYGEPAYSIVGRAENHGFTGFGIQQRSDVPHHKRFIHLDDLEDDIFHGERPWIWSY